MNIGELRRTIREMHGEQLARFRAQVLGGEGITDAGSSRGPRTLDLPVMEARSLTDRYLDLTFAADVADTAWLGESKTFSGKCLTVSIAGHHRLTGARMSLPPGESDAWVSEIVGGQWAPHLYRAGTLSGAGRLATVYYRLFLDETGNFTPRPEGFDHNQLRLISEL